MDRGKGPLLLPYPYTPSSSTMGLLLHLQCYQRWKPMIIKMSMKSKFVLSRYYVITYHVIITYWLKKEDKNTHVFEVLIFSEYVLLLSISRNPLQKPSIDDIPLGNFTLSNSIILVEVPEILKYFWLITLLVILQIKILKYKNI